MTGFVVMYDRLTHIKITPTAPGRFTMLLSRTERPEFEDAYMKGMVFTHQEVEDKLTFFRWAHHAYIWMSNMKEAKI